MSKKIRPEIIFLNELEKTLHKRFLNLYRQYNIDGYRIDGFIPELNIAIEFDEKQHRVKSQMIEDMKREVYIMNEIGCEFIRLDSRKSNLDNINIVVEFIDDILGKNKII